MAGAKSEEIVKKSPDHFLISVREKAKNNMANIRIRELVAREFKISAKKVRIISGHHSPSKIFSVEVER